MKILTVITTYNRPQLFTQLIRALMVEIEASGHEHEVLIADDGSALNYAEQAAEELAGQEIRTCFIGFAKNGGKKHYWHVMDEVYKVAQGKEWDVMVQLPDDVLPVPGMYNTAVEMLHSLKLPNVLINLYRCHREHEWGSANAFDINDKLRLTGWMDMCYACKRGAISALDYSVVPVNRDWHRSPELGSGVGAQLSRRLRQHNVSQYQVLKSLVVDTGDQASQMNPTRTFKFKTK